METINQVFDNLFRANSFDPILHGLSNELRAVVRPNERWDVAQDEQVAQHINDIA